MGGVVVGGEGSLVLARHRGLTTQLVSTCHACPLHTETRHPIPGTYPPRASVSVALGGLGKEGFGRFAVIGEAPGAEENKQGKPFIGKSGRFLRAMMREVGIEPGEVAWMNAVSCWPGEGTMTRAPGVDEMQACRVNLMDQIRASDVRCFLLVGATAVKAWRGDVKLTDVHGFVYRWMERFVVMPVYHPAAVLRDRSLKRVVMEDLGKWKRVVETGEMFPWNEHCARCIAYADEWDRDGVGYCGQHWGRYGGSWLKEMKKWKHRDVDTLRSIQGKLV